MSRLPDQLRALAAALLLLSACSKPKEVTVTFTKARLFGPAEVRVFEHVTGVRKKGWLTSDRWEVRTADGQVTVLPGQWEIIGRVEGE